MNNGCERKAVGNPIKNTHSDKQRKNSAACKGFFKLFLIKEVILYLLNKSFNQSAYDGAERFKEETGIEYREFEVTNPSQREQAIAKMAERKSICDYRHRFCPSRCY